MGLRTWTQKKEMSKKGQPWTTEEEKDMLDRLRMGVGFETVAREHERTVKAIQWRWGMHCQRRIHRESIDLSRLAREFHTSPEVLSEILEQMKPSPSTSASANTKSLEDKIDRMYDMLLKIVKTQKKILLRSDKK